MQCMSLQDHVYGSKSSRRHLMCRISKKNFVRVGQIIDSPSACILSYLYRSIVKSALPRAPATLVTYTPNIQESKWFEVDNHSHQTLPSLEASTLLFTNPINRSLFKENVPLDPNKCMDMELGCPCMSTYASDSTRVGPELHLTLYPAMPWHIPRSIRTL